MKHLFTLKSLLLTLVMLCGLNAWGEEVVLTTADYTWTAENNQVTQTIDPVTFNFNGGTTKPTYYDDGLRTYEKCVITISSKYTISKIAFTYTIKNSGCLKDVTTGTWDKSTKTWSGEATSVSLTVGHDSGSSNGQVKITKITVTYRVPVAAGEVAVPTFSPAGGTYYAPQQVEIQIPDGATGVLYTIDGSVPSYDNNNSELIDENTPITVSKTTTIKAIAVDDSDNKSAVAEATYTILPSFPNTQATAYTTAEAIALIDATSSEQLAAEKVYVKGEISKIDSFNDKYGSITYWLDNNTFEVYSGKNLNNTDFAAKTDIEIGASVIVYGNIKKYNSTYEFDLDNYLVEYTPVTVQSIAINGEATKTEYEAGETFSTAGLEVIATMSNGSTADVTSSAAWTFEPETLALGTTTVKVTATYQKFSASKDVNVTVVAAIPSVTLDLTTTAQIKGEPTTELLEYDATVLTVSSAKVGTGTAANNYYGGKGTNTSTRFYKGNSLTFTPAANFEIVSITYNATTEGYATALANSEWTNASATADVKTVTITPVDGTKPFSATIGGTTGAISMVIKYRVKTVTGLDAVLDAAHAGNVGGQYRINCALHVNYKDDNYVYASTIGGGSTKTAPTEAQKEEWWSDVEKEFNQNDWVAIQNSSLEVGDEIEAGSVATLVSNSEFPVIKFDSMKTADGTAIDANTYRVANFNIGVESPLVNKLWLVEPQPAEYCKVKGYVDVAYVQDDCIIVHSTESENADEYVTMKVYYTNPKNIFKANGWYLFEGIVVNGPQLKAVSYQVGSATGVEGVETSSVKVYGAEGVINVVSEEVAPIAVYSANGAIVSSVEASSASIAVAPGFYIVKAGNSVSKVTVK